MKKVKYSYKWKSIDQVMKEKKAMDTPETRLQRKKAFKDIFKNN